MSCDCYCHLLSTAPYCLGCSGGHPDYYAGYHPCVPNCPVCKGIAGGPHKKTLPKVTANNIWRIVTRIDETKDHAYNAHRFILRLRGASAWEQMKFGVIVASTELVMMKQSLRSLFAQHLNAEFATKGMPDYLRHCLEMSEDEAQYRFAQEMQWFFEGQPKKEHHGPGVYIESSVPLTYNDVVAAKDAIKAAAGYAVPNHWPHDAIYAPSAVDGATVTRDLRKSIPGIMEYVFCPVASCSRDYRILDMVQHLNDREHWTREQIADWLEALDVDLTFPVEPPEKPVLPTAHSREKLWIIARDHRTAAYEAKRRGRPQQLWQYLDQRDISRLRGTRAPQYCIVDDIDLGKKTQEMLLMTGAYEVGEEHPRAAELWQYPTAPTGVASILKEIYAPQLEQQMADAGWYESLMKKAQNPEIPAKMWVQVKDTFEGADGAVYTSSAYVYKKDEDVNYLDNVTLQLAMYAAPKAEWVDVDIKKVETDPLTIKTIKNSQAPSYGKFTHNPTKSKPKK